MYHVDWTDTFTLVMITRWFHSEKTAVLFSCTRKAAVVYDRDGKVIYQWPEKPASRVCEMLA